MLIMPKPPPAGEGMLLRSDESKPVPSSNTWSLTPVAPNIRLMVTVSALE